MLSHSRNRFPLSQKLERVPETETSEVESTAELRSCLAVLEGEVGGQRRIESSVVAADVEAGSDERCDRKCRSRIGVELAADVEGWIDNSVVANLGKHIF